jgi:hypothetical protein
MTSCIIHHSLLTSIPAPEKRDREREREKEEDEKGKRKKKGTYRDTGGVSSPSFSSHGGTRLDSFQGYAG